MFVNGEAQRIFLYGLLSRVFIFEMNNYVMRFSSVHIVGMECYDIFVCFMFTIYASFMFIMGVWMGSSACVSVDFSTRPMWLNSCDGRDSYCL